MSHRHYFIVSPEDISHSETNQRPTLLRLRGDEHRHLSRALRFKSGDEVWATNGRGVMYRGALKTVNREQSEIEILEIFENYGEEPLRLTLALGVPKMQRFEWILEKGTELGVARFIPMLTDHSVKFPKTQKLERWRRIVRAAVKQCGRSVIPIVESPCTFEAVLKQSTDAAYRWIAHAPRHDDKPLFLEKQNFETRENPTNGLLLIGAEGGFSGNEIKAAKDADFVFITLGKRRLRTETAALAAVVRLFQN